MRRSDPVAAGMGHPCGTQTQESRASTTIRAPRQQRCHPLAASARHEGGGAVMENRFFMMISIGLCRSVLAASRAAVSSFNACADFPGAELDRRAFEPEQTNRADCAAGSEGVRCMLTQARVEICLARSRPEQGHPVPRPLQTPLIEACKRTQPGQESEYDWRKAGQTLRRDEQGRPEGRSAGGGPSGRTL
jgi:hypothetical protein